MKIHSVTAKTKTVGGDMAKQYFKLYVEDNPVNENSESILAIEKLVLSSDFDLYKEFILLKQMNGIGLFQQTFEIKFPTLISAIQLLLESTTKK